MTAAVRGMTWSTIGKIVVKFVQFGFSIVLARLLCPSDFGLVGMIAIFIAVCDIFADCGFGAALVRKNDRTEDDYATVLWSKLTIAAVSYAVLFASAPWIARFYHEPRLVAITRVVSIGLMLSSAASVASIRLQVALKFGTMAAVSVASIFTSGIVGIVCAWRGLGVWAVVWQGFAWHVVNLVFNFTAVRWMPRLRFSVASFRAFFDFGWKHLARGLLGSVYGNVYGIVIGRSFGAADLGFYNRADYYTSEVGGMVGGVVNEVNYPLLSQLQNDNVRLRRAYRRLQGLVAVVMIPGMTVFAVCAEPIIRLLIGEQWTGCVPYLRVLAIGAAFSPLAGLAITMLYVKGRTDLALKLELVTKPIGFALLIAAIPFGILAICVAKSATTLLSLVVSGIVVRRVLKVGNDEG